MANQRCRRGCLASHQPCAVSPICLEWVRRLSLEPELQHVTLWGLIFVPVFEWLFRVYRLNASAKKRLMFSASLWSCEACEQKRNFSLIEQISTPYGIAPPPEGCCGFCLVLFIVFSSIHWTCTGTHALEWVKQNQCTYSTFMVRSPRFGQNSLYWGCDSESLSCVMCCFVFGVWLFVFYSTLISFSFAQLSCIFLDRTSTLVVWIVMQTDMYWRPLTANDMHLAAVWCILSTTKVIWNKYKFPEI